MKRVWEFISSASQSRTTAVLVVLILFAAIPLTVLVAQKQQELRQRAQEVPNCNNFDDNPFNDCPAPTPVTVTETPVQPTPPQQNPTPPSSGGGSGFGNLADCTTGQTCSVNELSKQRCTPDGTQFCVPVKGGGACWSPVTPCGSGMVCQYQTDGSGKCMPQGYTCSTFNTSGTCPPGQQCSNGACVTSPGGGGNQPTVTQPTPTSTPTTPAACAQFSQYCNSSGSCNWGSLPGTPACAGTVRSYYQTCLNATGNLEPTIQSICTPPTSPIPQPVTLSLTIGLDGLGTTGDSKNPNSSNKTPTKNSVTGQIILTPASGGSEIKVPATFAFESTSGKYKVAALSSSNLSAGTYNVKVKANGYLARQIPAAQTFTAGQTTVLPTVNLVVGDIDGDNRISITDYNILIGCWFPNVNNGQATCGNHGQDADLNADGAVNEVDYNLFLREFSSVQNGD